MLKFVLPLLILLCHQAVAQDRFIVYVSEFTSGNIGEAVVKCPASIITDRHVLTTAACATPTNSLVQLAIEIRIVSGTGFSSRTISADGAFIHPNYTGDVHSNNVAVVRMGGQFNISTLPPRTLGSIPASNPTCTLYGWGGALDSPETAIITPHTPEFCYSNRSQTYCSEHVSASRPCSAYVGSPLVCTPGSIDGVLIESDCLEESPGRFIQSYYSVGEFRDWIEIVSDAKLANQISVVTFLSALVICLKNLV